MEFNIDDYLSEVDALLIQAGAQGVVYAEVGRYQLKGYTLIKPDTPVIYVSTGIHGDEPAGPLAFLELLKGGLLDAELSFYLCPCLNPSGLELGTRENAKEFGGVDMNRDYTKKQSEEVAGHVQWLDGLKAEIAGYPSLFISLHEDWESKGFYFYEINTMEDDPRCYQTLVERIGKVMPIERDAEIDGHAVREDGWIFHRAEADLPDGWPEAIYLAKTGCPLSYTFETPSGFPIQERVRAHVEGVKGLLEYHYDKQ